MRNYYSKMKIYKIIILLIICHHSVCAQVVNQPMPPEISSLAKYSEIPVGNYTGVPNVSVPVYEIKVRDLSIPISLSYHASGIKVEEEAGWTGLGWSLNAEGSISRQIRGKDDFRSDGWNNLRTQMADIVPNNNFPYIHENLGPCLSPSDFVFPWNGTNRDYGPFGNTYFSSENDFQPDIYFFYIGGKSGKFFYDKDGNIQFIEQQKMKVEYTLNTSGFLSEWIVTTDDGYKYYFGSVQNSFVTPTSWYVTKVVTPKGETASFEYDMDGQIYGVPQYSCWRHEAGLQLSSAEYFDIQPGIFSTHYLKRIKFSTGSVQFISSSKRRDLENGKKLDKIIVWQNTSPTDSVSVKELGFQYSYFCSNNAANSSYWQGQDYFKQLYPTAYTDTFKIRNTYRLKLLSFGEKLANPYVFEYDNRLLPEKTSYSRDHWGYYNGQWNTTLLPNLNYKFSACNSLIHIYTFDNSGNREADSITNLAASSILTKITYPTGGYTAFQYEPNQYNNWVRLEKNNFSFPSNNTQLFFGDVDINGNNITPSANALFSFSSEEKMTKVTIGITFRWAKGGEQVCLMKDGQVIYTFENLPKSDQVNALSKTLDLSSGIYTLVPYYISSHTFLVPYASATTFKTSTGNGFGGGVRIKKNIDFDPLLNVAKTRNFKYGNGLLMSRPKYFTSRCRELRYSKNVDPASTFGCESWTLSDPELRRASYSNLPLSNSAQGGYVGYDTVSIAYSSGSLINGASTFIYHNMEDIQFSPEYTNINIPTYSDCLNGCLLEQTDYDKDTKPVKHTENVFTKRNLKIQLGLLSEKSIESLLFTDGCNGWSPCSRAVGDPSSGNEYTFHLYFYPNASQWITLDSKEETIYQPGTPVTTTTNYYYDNPLHYQLTRTKTVTSKNETVVSQTKYPEDYSTSTGYIQDLKNSFMHSLPLEKINYKFSGTDSLVTGAQKFTYKTGGQGLVDDIYRFAPQNGQPVSYQNYQNYYIPDTKVDNYANNNPVQFHKSDNMNTSYIWGYANTLPIVKGDNIDYSTLQTAYTSALSSAGISDFSEIMYPYANNSQSTKLKNFCTALYGNATLASAQLTVFTYAPLSGMTSMTDQRGITAYYVYDTFGRLQLVKDATGNIRQAYEYYYKKQK